MTGIITKTGALKQRIAVSRGSAGGGGGGASTFTAVADGAIAAGDRSALAKRLMTTDRAYTGGGYDDPIRTGGVGVKAIKRPTWTGDQTMAPNRDIWLKKGGRVKGAGKAKRGLGRAFSKGRK